MKELIKVNGEVDLNGTKIKVIEGGFGAENKAILFCNRICNLKISKVMIDNDKIQYLIDSNLEQVVSMQMSESKSSLEDALNVVYNSKWFQTLNNPDTGLYFQSALYNYELLKEECNSNIPLHQY